MLIRAPGVVIQQIYNESEGGNHKMIPIPGTDQYLTAHRRLGDYDQLLCVPLVHKVGGAAVSTGSSRSHGRRSTSQRRTTRTP